MQVTFGMVQYLNTGADGKDGVTFFPSVEGEDCTLSWTNDGGLPNPEPVNLKGKDGKDGKDGVDGKDGRDGVDGKDGADGKDGKDGKDGAAAEIPALSNLELEEILV